MKRLSLVLAASLLTGSTTFAQDMDVSRIGDSFNNYGVSGGIRAYSFSTTSCNVGNVVCQWNDSINEAPVIAQNMFRMYEGRFEQLGYSFLKEGFCAVNENSCGSCQSTNCDTLGIGCADTYGAGLNDGRNGVTKSQVNANTGVKPFNMSGPSAGSGTIRGRLQVLQSELALPGASYFIESQYVTTDDQIAGNHRNNASWRRVNVSPGNYGMSGSGATQRGNPAIYAWAAADPDVEVVEFTNLDEGGPGVHGYFFVAYKTTDLGNGQYRYEYAVQNLTSDISANSFSVSLPCGPVTSSELFFRDVDSHSGDPYDPTDWTFAQTGTELTWTGGDFAANPNSNAIRWGTLYNFGFTADAAPVMGNASLGLFKSGGELTEQIAVPGTGFETYCTATTNSTGSPADMIPSGSALISSNDINFLVTQLPFNSFGYMIMAQGQQQVPLASGSQGNLCVGGGANTIYRFSLSPLNSGFFGFVNFSPDLTNLPAGLVVMPGETWNFQYWFRDANPSVTSNTSNATSVEFCN
ncbi:MAG: hypothetical protein AAF957_20745 [Planctomycetota bacterium]